MSVQSASPDTKHPNVGASARSSESRVLAKLLGGGRQYGTVFLLAILIVVFSLTAEAFFTWTNFKSILITQTGVECLSNVPRQLFVKP